MQSEQNPLILTVGLDRKSQAFFNANRRMYFSPERNFLHAHLTLFHRLPYDPATHAYLDTLEIPSFEVNVCGLRNLGAGVAYDLKSLDLQRLYKKLQVQFQDELSPQDHQLFKPHITIQNKVKPEAAKKLLAELQADFEPFRVNTVGLDLWEYLGGPWRHSFSYPFVNHER